MPVVPIDPLASLRPWPIDVEIGEQTYTIPPLTATEWLEVMLQDVARFSTWKVLPGLLDEAGQHSVAEQLMNDDIQISDLHDAAVEAIEVACGRSWWWSLRMLALAKTSWPRVYGALLLAGVDPSRVSLAGFLDALYALVVQNMQPEKVQVLDMDLNQVPPGFEQELDEQAEGDAFMQMMQQAQQLPQ